MLIRSITRAILAFLFFVLAAPAPAEENPFTGNSKFVYGMIAKVIIAAAEKVPETDYNFKPTPEVRSYGQIVAHISDAQYIFCSIAMGVPNPDPKNEETKKTKAEIISALKESFAYCDKSYDGITDVKAAEKVKFRGMEMTKLGMYQANAMHTLEHYGNLVTYMRLKNIVPPTSDPEFSKRLASK